MYRESALIARHNNGVFACGKCVSNAKFLTRPHILDFVFARIILAYGKCSCGCFVACRRENLSPFTFRLDKESHGTISAKHVISKYIVVPRRIDAVLRPALSSERERERARF